MEYKKFIDKTQKNNLKFWDDSKVELKSFFLKEENKEIKYFRKKIDENGNKYSESDKNAKIISRSSFFNFRDPFIIEPWNQILVDDANKYGTMVDDNIEQYLNGKIQPEFLMEETKMSIAKSIKNHNLIWVSRSQMVCHPESLIYGEIDEIWYDLKNNEYIVGDTKTSSSVNKLSYWYQIGVYIEILRKLNPNKKISAAAHINWTRIKNNKRKLNENFCSWSFCTHDSCKQQEKYNREFLIEKGEKKFICESKLRKIWNNGELDEFSSLLYFEKFSTKPSQIELEKFIYNLKWGDFVKIDSQNINKMIVRDLEKDNILNIVKEDIKLISDYKITSPEIFNDLLNKNPKFEFENSTIQRKYDNYKKIIEKENNN